MTPTEARLYTLEARLRSEENQRIKDIKSLSEWIEKINIAEEPSRHFQMPRLGVVSDQLVFDTESSNVALRSHTSTRPPFNQRRSSLSISAKFASPKTPTPFKIRTKKRGISIDS